jgi:multicomponent Na+:H+ antiporter subunit D
VQVITIAALGRAAWLAFFRPAQHGQAPGIQPGEQLRPGMLAGLVSLGACCVAFGAAGLVVLRRLMAPAVASLLDPGRYASGVLAGSGRLPVLHIPFDYVSPAELGAVAGTLAVGAWLAWAYLRTGEPRVISGLRAVHTGSANDYAGYAIAGMLAILAVLGLA